MRLTNILREIEDAGDNNGRGVRVPHNMVLIPVNASLQDLENALNDDSNYEAYSRNVQNVGSAALQSKIDSEKAKIFGPTGNSLKDRTPNAKVKKAKELWDAADTEWRKDKAKDIKSRFPEFDITGWEKLEFDQLPKEAKKYNIFWDFITGPKLDALISKVKSGFSTSEKPLNWEEENGELIFPPDFNPENNQIEKIITTVMKNAGITGKKQYIIKSKPIKDFQSKTDQSINPIEFRDVEDYIADDIKDEIESKYPNLTVSILSSEDSRMVIVQIKGFTSNQERTKVQGEASQTLSDLSEGLMKRMFQVRAGIIK